MLFHLFGELPPVLYSLLDIMLWFGVGEGGKGWGAEHLGANRDEPTDPALGTVDVLGQLEGGF